MQKWGVDLKIKVYDSKKKARVDIMSKMSLIAKSINLTIIVAELYFFL